MDKKFYFYKIIIINALLFLLIIFTIEIMVRHLYPQINSVGEDGSLIDRTKFGETYGYKPYAEAYSFGAKVITDKNGFRVNLNRSIENSNKNILILGDSVSMGVGVDSENIFASKIFSDFKNIIAINASVTGYSFLDYLNILPKIINDDYIGIVLCICLNDFSRISQKNIVAKTEFNDDLDKKQRYPNIFVRTLRKLNDDIFNFNSFLRCHFRTYLWIKSLVTDSSRDHFFADMLRYQNTENMSEIIRDQFVQILKIQKKSKSWVLIFLFPYEYQLRLGTKETLFLQELILQSTIDLGLNIVDLYSPIRKYMLDNGIRSQDLFIFNDPFHFSTEGHKIIADIMRAEINRRGLLSGN